MPSFATLRQSPPPPPVQASDSSRAQETIAYISVAVIGLLVLMFSLCLFFFFSPQLREFVRLLLGRGSAKYGRPGADPADGRRGGKRRKKREKDLRLGKLRVENMRSSESRRWFMLRASAALHAPRPR